MTDAPEEDVGPEVKWWACGETEAEREQLRKAYELGRNLPGGKEAAIAELQKLYDAEAANPAAVRRLRNAFAAGSQTSYRKPSTGQETWRSIREGFVYVGQQGRFVRVADGQMWDVDKFQKQFGYVAKHIKTRQIGEDGETSLQPIKKTLTSYIFKLDPWPGPGLKTYDTFGFTPGGEFDNVRGVFNQWRPSDVTPKEGDTALWDAHLSFMFADEDARNRLLDWYSWVYCNQDKHPDCALMIQGQIQGTGKSFLNLLMHRLLCGTAPTPITQRMLTADHETWPLRTKLAILEIRAAERRVTDRLHDLITGTGIPVDMKNAPDFTIPNVLAIVTEANPRNALAGLDNSDRRWLMVSTDQGDKLLQPNDEATYYRPLYSHFNLGKLDVRIENPPSLAAVAYQLKARNGGAYHGGRAMMTAAKVEIMAASASDLEKWLVERVESGGTPFNLCVFPIEEIAIEVPHDIKARHGEGLRDKIGEILKDKLGGENLGQVRIGGEAVVLELKESGVKGATERPRLWTVHHSDGTIIREFKPFKGRYSDKALARIYRTERKVFTAEDKRERARNNKLAAVEDAIWRTPDADEDDTWLGR